MFENVRVANYVKQHEHELDQIMKDVFEHWNKIGQIDKDEKVSNKMQIIFLVSVIRIWIKTAGMPKETQKEVLQGLLNSLGD